MAYKSHRKAMKQFLLFCCVDSSFERNWIIDDFLVHTLYCSSARRREPDRRKEPTQIERRRRPNRRLYYISVYVRSAADFAFRAAPLFVYNICYSSRLQPFFSGDLRDLFSKRSLCSSSESFSFSFASESVWFYCNALAYTRNKTKQRVCTTISLGVKHM